MLTNHEFWCRRSHLFSALAQAPCRARCSSSGTGFGIHGPTVVAMKGGDRKDKRLTSPLRSIATSTKVNGPSADDSPGIGSALVLLATAVADAVVNEHQLDTIVLALEEANNPVVEADDNDR
jgi:hypothetical protein